MKPKISIITLGVEDVARAKSFYKKLGFPLHSEDKEDDVHPMFELEGTWLALFDKKSLAEGAGMEVAGSGGIVLAHNVESKEKVDEVTEEARSAGAKVLVEPKEVFWGGYSSYIRDLDGHVWSIAWNPFTDLTQVSL